MNARTSRGKHGPPKGGPTRRYWLPTLGSRPTTFSTAPADASVRRSHNHDEVLRIRVACGDDNVVYDLLDDCARQGTVSQRRRGHDDKRDRGRADGRLQSCQLDELPVLHLKTIERWLARVRRGTLQCFASLRIGLDPFDSNASTRQEYGQRQPDPAEANNRSGQGIHSALLAAIRKLSFDARSCTLQGLLSRRITARRTPVVESARLPPSLSSCRRRHPAAGTSSRSPGR